MKKILLLIALLQQLVLADTIHSSVSTYLELKDYSGSVQKNDAVVYGVGADVHYKGSAYKLAYESANGDTKQPPLKNDLNFQKIFLKYGYEINEKFEFNINYINILHDNIAITDDGQVYGAGLTYNLNKKLSLNYTQFYTDYDDFNVYQSDFTVDFNTKLNGVKLGLTSISKYINIDEDTRNAFTKNAANSYFTSGFKFHSHYKSYHLGLGAYFGKRAFAVMQDGFKVQHHAMEFDRTYAIGAGKTIGKFVFRMQYIYQRAKEMPMQNDNVRVQVYRFIGNYKF